MALVLNCWESAYVVGSTLTINKPTSGSANGDAPKNAAVGDLLVIIIGSDDNSSIAQWDDSDYKPAGFTLINEVGNSTEDCHCAAFYKVVDGSEGASFAVPTQSSDDLWGSCILISGYPSLHLVGADCVDNTPPIAITGVSCTEADCLAFYVAAFDGGDDGGFSVAGTGWAERAEIRTGTGSGNGAGCWGTRQMSGTGETGTATVSVVVSDGMVGFQFAIMPGVEGHSGTASISGNGSQVGTVKKAGKGTSLISAVGALVVTGAIALFGIGGISGNGAIASTGAKAGSNIATISGNGSLTATGTKSEGEEHSGTALISSGGSLSASGVKAVSDIAAISGNGSLSASGVAVETHFGTASVSGGGSLAADGEKGAADTGSISGNGLVVCSASKSNSDTGAISGGGSTSADGEKQGLNSASISGNGSLSGDAEKESSNIGLISAGGSLMASGIAEEEGSPDRFGEAILSGGGSWDAIATRQASGAAALSGPAHMVAQGMADYPKTQIGMKDGTSTGVAKRIAPAATLRRAKNGLRH